MNKLNWNHVGAKYKLFIIVGILIYDLVMVGITTVSVYTILSRYLFPSISVGWVSLILALLCLTNGKILATLTIKNTD